MKSFIGLCFILMLSACNLASPTETPSLESAPLLLTPAQQATPSTSECIINIGQMMNVYDTPGNWGIITGRLAEGDTVAVLESSSNGWYRVEGVMSGWVGGNAAFPEGNCGNLPVVQAQPPLTDCQVTNASGAAQILYASPQVNDGNSSGRFPANETMPVIRKEGEWYLVYVAAFSNGMWIQTSLVSASPECANLP